MFRLSFFYISAVGFEAVVSRDLVLLEGSHGREAEDPRQGGQQGCPWTKVLSGLPSVFG